MGQKEEKEKIKTARETLGRYFYDLSKTSFGTGLLGRSCHILQKMSLQ